MNTSDLTEFGRRVRLVGDRMAAVPWALHPSDSMTQAFELMREHVIRHVPIVSGGEVVGIVSERLLNTYAKLRDVDPRKVPLAEVMITKPYTVTPETPLAEVVHTMAYNKYGSAIVVRGRQIVGIFTTTDALCELERILEGHSSVTPEW
ncbi:MAG TPA: CBS domain-containing protein [Polyangiaceae bacterium]